LIKDEMLQVKEQFGDQRRTEIDYAGGDLSIEDMIPDEQVVITLSHAGYVKRTSLSEYKVQNRGGVGQKGVTTRDEDYVEQLFTATNHNYLLFFTEQGRCFWLKVYESPEGSKASKGRAIQNLIALPSDDKIRALINVETLKDEAYINNHFITLCTQEGIIKKTTLEAYSRPRANGINAITVRDGDRLLEARLSNGSSEILIASSGGKCIRFNESTVRPMGRNASGVRAIRLEDGERAIGMVCVDQNAEVQLLVLSEKGVGKRSEVGEYRMTNRGGKGVKAMNVTDKTGALIALIDVDDSDDLMITNQSGVMIRMPVRDLRVMGRNTQGVKLINLKGNDRISSIMKVPADEAIAEGGEGDILPTEENPGSLE
jgi:DNA gyrase subunit A